MKKSKLIFIITNFICLIAVVIYTPLFAIKRARDYEIYTKPSVESKIYTVWHIETFEGGSKARINYLKSIASIIEKQNDGVLFYIKSINPTDLEAELSNATPDIISFGYGVGQTVLSKLLPLDNTFSVRDELVASGMYNNKLYAIPYIASGYATITHGVLTDNVHAGSEYTSVLPILNQMQVNLTENESGYEAYKDFVYNKDVTLIGTGRDVFRVDNLNAVGRANAQITPIDYYTDLIQYIGICNADNISLKFLSFALDKNRQATLSDYHLYSTLYDKIYSTGIYNDMENAIYSCTIPNAFYEKD